MCTHYYVEPQSFPSFIARAQRTVLANDLMVKLGKPLKMSGEIRPTDVKFRSGSFNIVLSVNYK